jgi:hypothetical protein
MSVTLHPELGVNPRMINVHCFVCGETKEEGLALLGMSNFRRMCNACDTWVYGGIRKSDGCPRCGEYNPGDREELKDHEHISNNGPCEQCTGLMEQGVVCISVRDDPDGDPDNPYRTGGWAVVTDEAIRRIVQPQELAEGIIRKRMAFIPDDAWALIGLPAYKTEEDAQ